MLNKDILHKFRKLLRKSGYISFYQAFGDGNKKQNMWEKYVEKTDEQLKNLIYLFLLNRKLETSLAQKLVGEDVFNALIDATILLNEDGFTYTDKYVLITFKSILFFCEHIVRPEVYFGNDSIALGTYQIPAGDGIVLDLCSGSAIQAMIAALHCKKAHAVEINERAAKIARFNVFLNSLENKVEVHNLSYQEFHVQNQEKFDLIIFNPPLLPIPEVVFYPFVGDGGEDGLKITKEILDMYIPRLSENGSIQFVGLGLGKDREITFVDELSEITKKHDSSGFAQLVGHSKLNKGDGIYDNTVYTTAMNNNITMEMCYTIFDLHFKKLDVNEMYVFYIYIDKDESKTKKIRINDLSFNNANWFIA